MEDTAYNRKIAQQVRAINQHYIKDAEMKGYMLKDMPITRNTVGRGADFEGSGILSGLLGSIGLGKQGGAYMRGGAMHGGAMQGAGFLDTLGSLAPLAMLALGKPKKAGRPRKMAGAMTGEGFLDDLADGAMSVGKTALSLAPLLALGKPKRKHSKMSGKGMMTDAFRDVMHMAEALGKPKRGRKKGGEIALNLRDETFATPSASGRRRRGGISTGGISTGGISTGGLSRKLLGARAVGSGMTEMEGAGFFDDLLGNVNNVISTATQGAQLAKLLRGKGKKATAGIATGGRRRRGGIQTGGGIFDDILSGVSGVINTATQGAQLAKLLKGKGKKMGGIATGGKRGVSPWIAHVKAYAKKHGMKYNECLKDAGCKSSYKKM